jgi:hypothetical protein
MQTNSTLRCAIIIYYVIHFFVYICFTDKNTDPLMVLKLAKAMIQKNYSIEEATIQVEEYTSDMDDCKHCQDLPE